MGIKNAIARASGHLVIGNDVRVSF